MKNTNHVPTAGFFERASLMKGISYGPVPPIPLWSVPYEVFYRLFLWSFKKCSIKHFLMMQPKKWSALAIFFQRKKTCIIAVLCKIPTLSYDRAL